MVIGRPEEKEQLHTSDACQAVNQEADWLFAPELDPWDDPEIPFWDSFPEEPEPVPASAPAASEETKKPEEQEKQGEERPADTHADTQAETQEEETDYLDEDFDDYLDEEPEEEEEPFRVPLLARLSRLLVVAIIAAVALLLIALLDRSLTGTEGFVPERSFIEKIPEQESTIGPDLPSEYVWLSEHESLFPAGKVAQAQNNPELAHFLYRYGTGDFPAQPEEKAVQALREDELAADIPMLYQWDDRWGFLPYGSSVIGLTGCGPTCLSSVVIALTGDASATPDRVADFAMENDYYMQGVGTEWSLFSEGADAFGIRGKQIPGSLDAVKEELAAGRPCIASVGKGDFTDAGHFLVIAGADGDFLFVCDPNSIANTRVWAWSDLKGQILNLWSFSRQQ